MRRSSKNNIKKDIFCEKGKAKNVAKNQYY